MECDNDIIWIAVFDIGKCNFCFYIEEISLKRFDLIKNIIKSKRYNPNGTCTKEFDEILKQVYLNGTIKLIKNVNLTKGTDKNKYFDIELCHNLIDVLDEYSKYWDNCSLFVVEQQMSFGKKTNTMALKLGQHCESYFLFKYGRFRTVIEFPSYHKTQVLGTEKLEKQTVTKKKTKVTYKTVDKYARKKWSIEKGAGILTERNDFKTLSEIMSTKKKDDYMDNITQMQAFKYLYFVDKVKF